MLRALAAGTLGMGVGVYVGVRVARAPLSLGQHLAKELSESDFPKGEADMTPFVVEARAGAPIEEPEWQLKVYSNINDASGPAGTLHLSCEATLRQGSFLDDLVASPGLRVSGGAGDTVFFEASLSDKVQELPYRKPFELKLGGTREGFALKGVFEELPEALREQMRGVQVLLSAPHEELSAWATTKLASRSVELLRQSLEHLVKDQTVSRETADSVLEHVASVQGLRIREELTGNEIIYETLNVDGSNNSERFT